MNLSSTESHRKINFSDIIRSLLHIVEQTVFRYFSYMRELLKINKLKNVYFIKYAGTQRAKFSEIERDKRRGSIV